MLKYIFLSLDKNWNISSYVYSKISLSDDFPPPPLISLIITCNVLYLTHNQKINLFNTQVKKKEDFYKKRKNIPADDNATVQTCSLICKSELPQMSIIL